MLDVFGAFDLNDTFGKLAEFLEYPGGWQVGALGRSEAGAGGGSALKQGDRWHRGCLLTCHSLGELDDWVAGAGAWCSGASADFKALAYRLPVCNGSSGRSVRTAQRGVIQGRGYRYLIASPLESPSSLL